eukprot:403334504
MNYLQKLKPLVQLSRQRCLAVVSPKMTLQSYLNMRLLTQSSYFSTYTTKRYFNSSSTIASAQKYPIQDQVQDFFERYSAELQQANETPTQMLSTISRFMKEILDTYVSYNQHQQFAPVADELAHYVVSNINSQIAKNKHVSIPAHQAMTFVQFGTVFELYDKDYWRSVIDSLVRNIIDLTFTEQFQIITILKNQSMLTNALVSSVLEKQKDSHSTLSPSELVQYVCLLNSDYGRDVSQAFRNQSMNDKLEYYLSKNIDIMHPNEFATLCNSMVGSQSEPILYLQFLKDAIPRVLEWLHSNEFQLDMISSVAAVYTLAQQSIDVGSQQALQEQFEDVIFKNCERLTPEEAIQIFQMIHRDASADVVEVVDRIVGNNIHDINAGSILQAYLSFLSSGKARTKILALLGKRVREELFNYTGSEIVQLLKLQVPDEGEVDHSLLELAEPYLLNKLNSLSTEDVMDLIQIFNNKNIGKRYEILEEVEGSVINSPESLDAEELVTLLYFYAKNRQGSRLMISTLTNALTQDSKTSLALDPQIKLQLLVALNITGDNKEQIDALLSQLESSVDSFSQDELYLIDRLLAMEDQNDFKYENLRTAVNQRIQKQ